MTSHQTAAFLIGLGLGATLMLGLVKIGIIAPEANPVPLLACWLMVLAAWLLGWAVRAGRI